MGGVRILVCGMVFSGEWAVMTGGDWMDVVSGLLIVSWDAYSSLHSVCRDAHIHTGKIVRMLLIQMQYVKKELLVAMQGACSSVLTCADRRVRALAPPPTSNRTHTSSNTRSHRRAVRAEQGEHPGAGRHPGALPDLGALPRPGKRAHLMHLYLLPSKKEGTNEERRRRVLWYMY